jgi:hypothetical protein
MKSPLGIHHALVPTIFAVTLGAMMQARASANLVANPSFEADVVPDNGYILGTPLLWTPIGGGADVLRSGYLGTSVVPEGMQWADLIGGGGGNSGLVGGPFPSGISQSVTLTQGVPYSLSFSYSGSSVSAPLDVSISGLFSISLSTIGLNPHPALGPATPWSTFTTVIEPSVTGDYQLSFTTASGSYGAPHLDNVILMEVQAEDVPEPSTYAAAGFVAALAGFQLWRRRACRA